MKRMEIDFKDSKNNEFFIRHGVFFSIPSPKIMRLLGKNRIKVEVKQEELEEILFIARQFAINSLEADNGFYILTKRVLLASVIKRYKYLGFIFQNIWIDAVFSQCLMLGLYITAIKVNHLSLTITTKAEWKNFVNNFNAEAKIN